MLRFRQKPAKTKTRQANRPGRSPIFSYYNNRPADSSSTKSSTRRRIFKRPLPAQSLRLRWRHIPTYIASIFIIGSLAYSTVLSTQPKILLGRSSTSNILIRSPAIYQAGIASILGHSIFNRSKLTMDTATIETKIKHAYPEIQNVTVSIPFVGHRPVVGLDPASPTLIIATKSGSFIVDETGRVLVNLSEITPAARPVLPIVQDSSGLAVEQGSQALPKDNVTFITTVLQQLSAKKIKVQTIQLPAIPNQLQITPEGAKYFVKFDLTGDARLQVGAYLAVLGKLKSQNIAPAEYVDVRVDGRAYYK